MAATIKIKNSSTTGAVPTASDLVQGELAVNVTDTGLYTENASGTVVKLNAPSIDDKNTGATKHLTISTGGNIGLGVTPSAWTTKALQIDTSGTALSSVNGTDLVFSAYYNAGWKYQNSSYAPVWYSQAAGQHRWYTAPSGTAGNAITFTQAMTLDASGNLGLGATTVNSMMHLRRDTSSGSSTSYPNIRIDNPNASGYTGLYFYADTTQKAGFEVSNSAGALQMLVANAERARIDSSGNLLVGTTSSFGNTKCSVGGGFNIFIANTTSAAGTGYYLFAGYSGASAPGTLGTQRFYVLDNGDVRNTNNSYGAISDARLKENITDATPKLEKLQQVRIVNFNMKGDAQKQLGVIAQELEQIFPGMVDEYPDRDADGNDLGTTTKSVKYSVFVPMLIKAIQEQQAIITQLQADVAALKGQA